jgi:hypothetical protein
MLLFFGDEQDIVQLNMDADMIVVSALSLNFIIDFLSKVKNFIYTLS